jgi:ABC-type branched-subunit amino acid transport system substrate-binding protein
MVERARQPPGGPRSPDSFYQHQELQKKTMRVVFSAILSLVFASFVQADDKRELRVGGIFDLSSGAGVVWGTAERNAFLLAIEDFEKAHSDLRVVATIEDSAYSNTKAVTALQKLISVDRHRYVVGPTWEVFHAAMPVCESRKIVCIAPSYNNEAFEDPKIRYSFTAWFDDRDYARVHSPRINSDGFKRIAVFSSISPYYDSMVDALLPLLTVQPLTVERMAADTRDFKSIITRTPEGIDALVVFILGDGGAQNFFRQWGELRKERPLVFTDDVPLFFNPPMDLSTLNLKVIHSTTDIRSDRLSDFNQRYATRFGAEPGASSGGVTYDSTQILLECVRIHDPNSEAVRDCVASTHKYNGVSGNLSFNGGQSIKERAMVARELK